MTLGSKNLFEKCLLNRAPSSNVTNTQLTRLMRRFQHFPTIIVVTNLASLPILSCIAASKKKSVCSDQAPNPIPARGKAIDHFLGPKQYRAQRWLFPTKTNRTKQITYLPNTELRGLMAWPGGFHARSHYAVDMVENS